MKLSVVTTSFNSATTIRDTLLSVNMQTYPDVEHVVADGGSRDETIRLVSEYGTRVSKVISEPDGGIYDAMNKGWSLTSGEVVGFLNSDDIFASNDSLLTIAAAFDDPSIDACFGDLVYVSETDPSKVVRHWKSKVFVPGDFARGWQPAHPTFYVRRRVFERLGGFNLAYRIQSDFDLCMRFLEIGRIKSVYIPQVLVRMRLGGASNSSWRNVLQGNLEAYRACRASGLHVSPFFIPRKVFSKLPQFFAGNNVQ